MANPSAHWSSRIGFSLVYLKFAPAGFPRVASKLIVPWTYRCLIKESYPASAVELSQRRKMRTMMSLHARRELLAEVGPRYRHANKTLKQRILDEFTAATGYQRKYAIALLNQPPQANRPKTARKTRPKTYDSG